MSTNEKQSPETITGQQSAIPSAGKEKKDTSGDGWMNFLRADGTNVPAGFYLSAHAVRQETFLATVSAEEHQDREYKALIVLNDLATPSTANHVISKERAFSNMEQDSVSLTKAALAVMQSNIDKAYAEYRLQGEDSEAEEMRVLQYGKKLGYLNIFGYREVNKEVQLFAYPGFLLLRDKNAKQRNTYIQQREFALAKPGVGELVTAKYAWNDPTKNTWQVSASGNQDYSNMI